jgi:eukaryotic-like serine/threonine-protein kinase
MALRAGERLGPYEILGAIGAGGMGEVYRARDSRLGRAVAIKVLPAAVSSDPARRRRFEHEARATGLLNHPNILAVHDVGDHEGAPYLVAELLEGETLRGRLQAGTVPLRKAVDYALQVTRGLAAAHDKGVIHRDIKPENLFVTNDGIVKILDFGLARQAVAGTEEDTHSPTLARETGPGVVLGTVAYMSPEQARGETVDHRSDLFALGSVLYEMLSGRRAFHGDTSVETLNAILKEEPPEFPEEAKIPPALDRLVRHCLEKKPGDRFQSARDLVFELEGLSGSSATLVRSAPVRAVPVKRRWLIGAVAGLAALLLSAGSFFVGRHTAPPKPLKYQRLTFRRGTVWSARFAPDGKTIVYGAAWEGQPIRIFITVPGSPESRPLDLPDADILAISSSGEMALSLDRRRYDFVGMTEGTLARAPWAGGAPRPLLESVFGADWSPDGKELAIVREQPSLKPLGRRRTLEFPAGHVVYDSDPSWALMPRVSPRGDLVAFSERGSVAIVDRGGNKRTLVPGTKRNMNSLVWSPKGDEIWFGGSLRGDEWAIYAVDLQGRMRVVAELPFVGHLLDLQPDGRALLSLQDERGGVVALAPGATREQDVSWLDWSWLNDLSPDGTAVIFEEAGQGGARRGLVYLRRTDGAGPALLVTEGGDQGSVNSVEGLFPQKDKVLFWNGRTPNEIVVIPTGAGETRRVRTEGITIAGGPLYGFPDGQRFLVRGHEPGRPPRGWVQPVTGGRPIPATPEGALPVALSPDGRWIAARGADKKLLLCPVTGGDPRPAPGPPETGRITAWSADGKALFVTEVEGVVARAYRRDLVTGRRDLVQEIRPPDPAGLSLFRLLMAPDGHSYAYWYYRDLSALFLVEGLK